MRDRLHRWTRLAALSWWLLAALLFAAAALRLAADAEDRGALRALMPLYFLGLPLSHAALAAVNRAKLELWLASEFAPSMAAEGAWLWAALAFGGYLQWFVLLPLVARGVRRLVRGKGSLNPPS